MAGLFFFFFVNQIVHYKYADIYSAGGCTLYPQGAFPHMTTVQTKKGTVSPDICVNNITPTEGRGNVLFLSGPIVQPWT